MMITNHIFDSEVFNGYPTVVLNQIIRNFVVKISTLPFNLDMILCQEFDSLAPIATTLLWFNKTDTSRRVR
jgi:hypothetical protein